MVDRVLANIMDMDKIGLLSLILAGFITYGARFIVEKVLKIQSDRTYRFIIICKLVGLLIGTFGFLKITKII
ncbi:MAG TPA: hypothetical protein VFD57_04500 [Clostridia bacterium]|nr:hypothetical protein [Clostridia bacterium]